MDCGQNRIYEDVILIVNFHHFLNQKNEYINRENNLVDSENSC